MPYLTQVRMRAACEAEISPLTGGCGPGGNDRLAPNRRRRLRPRGASAGLAANGGLAHGRLLGEQRLGRLARPVDPLAVARVALARLGVVASETAGRVIFSHRCGKR